MTERLPKVGEFWKDHDGDTGQIIYDGQDWYGFIWQIENGDIVYDELEALAAPTTRPDDWAL